MHRYNILIVDDEPANIYLLEELLSGYNTETASCGSEMFRIMEEFTPDLILLDIMMPETDGITLAGRLRESEKFRDIPVIFISARDSGRDVAEGLGAGAEDYIKKPFDNDELIARVKRALSSRESKTELYRKATRDALTGVFNREYFFESLLHRISKAERKNLFFSIGIIDIDHFKLVNDDYGHQAGDMVLKNLTGFISKSLREYDILARYGGEEFIFILDGAVKNQAFLIMDRIREQVSEMDIYPEYKLRVTFSCGLADITEIERPAGADLLVKIADRRLYLAKSRGRNRIIFED